MALTFNKRDVEKRKQQKKLEKQKRKEARKANAGKTSFEDMIAYVDENGMITDTPVDPSEIEEIDASRIEVSVPPKEVIEEETVLSGKVDFFNTSKGFGFIKQNDSRESYFFHISNAPEDITDGDSVTFELERGPRGMNAVKVQIVK